jgi:hypothetical protein
VDADVYVCHFSYPCAPQNFVDEFFLRVCPALSRTYVDSRLQKMLDISFNVPMFSRGNFPATYQNGSQLVALQNPWAGRGNSAPFDQRKGGFG